MVFKSRYSLKREPVFSVAGDGIEHTYKLKVDDNGVRKLKRVGKINAYEHIQSFADSTDIHVILQRFAATGDTSLMNVRQGMYGDFTSLPKSMADMMQRVIDAEHLFASLPIDVREQFNHDPSQFFARMGTPEFNDWYNAYYGNKVDVDPVAVDTVVSTPVQEGVEE